MSILHTSVQQCAGGPSKYNEARKQIKDITNIKKEETLSETTWFTDMIVYIEKNHKKSTAEIIELVNLGRSYTT